MKEHTVEVFEVFAQSPASVDPSDGPFHHPAPGQNLEALLILGLLHNLDFPGRSGDGLGQLRAAIGAVGEDCPQQGKPPPGALIKHQNGAVAVLHVGRVDHGGEDQAKGIDQEMALLAFDLLTRIIAWRVDRDPPFSALFTL